MQEPCNPDLVPQDTLDALARLADEAGSPRVAAEVRSLADRVGDGRFFVACVGQFKRGKSSLVNALVGEPLLPVGVVPVTAAVTVVRYGPARDARVRFASGEVAEVDPGSLADWVTEAKNPENVKGVAGVEIRLPHPLLASGLCLVDTPGVGSVFAGNTATTRKFVPQVDAALVVLGADPPLTAEEADLVAEVARQADGSLILACNKADRLPEPEAREAAAFARDVLGRRLGRDPGPVLLVSATEHQAGTGPERDWPALEAALSDLALSSGRALVLSASVRGRHRLASTLGADLAARRDALLRPLHETEARVAALARCVEDAVTATGDLEPLFAAEQRRLARAFERQKEAFLEQAVSAAKEALARALRSPERAGLPARCLHPAAEQVAREIAERWLDAWLAEVRPLCEDLYLQATNRFTAIAAGFLERLASEGTAPLAGLPRVLEPETGFRVPSGLFYTRIMTLTGQGPWGWILACLRDREATLTAIERKVGTYLERLIRSNASRIQHDFDDRVRESHRRVLRRVRDLLEGVRASGEEALARARRLHDEGARAVEDEIARIDRWNRALDALRCEAPTRLPGAPP
ncbi:MAG: dynamin family protein [Deltaproteobacteria bacterium]|nr:dynamin family protein [Deltaproteobacteria bacterium]